MELLQATILGIPVGNLFLIWLAIKSLNSPVKQTILKQKLWAGRCTAVWMDLQMALDYAWQRSKSHYVMAR